MWLDGCIVDEKNVAEDTTASRLRRQQAIKQDTCIYLIRGSYFVRPSFVLKLASPSLVAFKGVPELNYLTTRRNCSIVPEFKNVIVTPANHTIFSFSFDQCNCHQNDIEADSTRHANYNSSSGQDFPHFVKSDVCVHEQQSESFQFI